MSEEVPLEGRCLEIPNILGSWRCFQFLTKGSIRGDEMRFQEIIAWCHEQFGQPDESLTKLEQDSRWFYSVGHMMITLRVETDAAAFKMRWC